MNKKLIIVLIGILATLSLSTGVYYMTSLNKAPVENITLNNDSEDNSSNTTNYTGENTANGNSRDANPRQGDTNPNRNDVNPRQGNANPSQNEYNDEFNNEYYDGACW